MGVLQYFAFQCFVNFFIAGEAREQARLLPHPGRAGVAGPGLRLVAPRGGAQTGQVRSGQVLLTIYWNPVLIRYDYFELFQEKKEKNHSFQTIRVGDKIN